MTHEMPDGQSHAARATRHRLLPIAGGGVAAAALLAQFGGGALVMHVGLPAVLAYFGLGAAVPTLGAGALVVGIVVAVGLKLLVFGVFGGVFGGRQWFRRR